MCLAQVPLQLRHAVQGVATPWFLGPQSWHWGPEWQEQPTRPYTSHLGAMLSHKTPTDGLQRGFGPEPCFVVLNVLRSGTHHIRLGPQ